MAANNIILIAHYFPPINSSGGRRMLAMSKYFSKRGRNVTVLTTTKKISDGEFTESFPSNVTVLEISSLGKLMPTKHINEQHTPPETTGRRSLTRRIKDMVMSVGGQIPDPRLPFALSFLNPFLHKRVVDAIKQADIVVATTPPWPPLLAAIIIKLRFRKPVILDYRDQFSRCHEMPGGKFAKALEEKLDRSIAKRGDALVSISEPMAEYYRGFNNKSAVIMNGYDPEPLNLAQIRLPWQQRERTSPLIIRYMGLVSQGRIPRNLLSALEKLINDKKIEPADIRFEFFGDVGILFQYLEAKHPSLLPLFHFNTQVAYGKALELIVSADHVLFCENSIPPQPGESASAHGILTTKLFEYLASTRPVIAHISAETLAGSFIVRASNDHFVSDKEEDFLNYLVSDNFWKPSPVFTSSFVHSLSRSSQADEYLHFIDEVYRMNL